MDKETQSAVLNTLGHVHEVGKLIADVTDKLTRRAIVHDLSKFGEDELAILIEETPKLKSLTYGSVEYNAALVRMRPMTQHHYKHNRHHPEHWPNGIHDMTLLDLIEMLCDWKAASRRHADGSIIKSLEVNRDRFNIPDPLYRILFRTAVELGWIEEAKSGDELRHD